MIEDRIRNPVKLSQGDESYFFGYFDKSPYLTGGVEDLVLVHRSKNHRIMPLSGESIDIGYIAGGGFVAVTSSTAWNFQQGTMLQWVPGKRNSIIFNDFCEGVLVCKYVNFDTGEEKLYSEPVAAFSPTGKEFVSIDFRLLSYLKPEYGYAFPDQKKLGDVPNSKGLSVVNFESGDICEIVSLDAVKKLSPAPGSEECIHYINHPLYSPDGQSICFLHRYITRGGTQATRFLVCNRDGSNLRILISGMASHFGWRNREEVLAWAGERRLLRGSTKGIVSALPIGLILKKAYRFFGKPSGLKSRMMQDQYILFNTKTGARSVFAKSEMTCDGHCSFRSDTDWFVTDTYPDKNGRVSIILGNIGNGSVIRVGLLDTDSSFDGEIRCDLHPRWHPVRPEICFDAAFSGKRALYALNVADIVGV